MKKMSTLDWVSMILLGIGGLNWGLVGLFGFDLVAVLFGYMTPLTRVVYIAIGLSVFYVFFRMTSKKHD